MSRFPQPYIDTWTDIYKICQSVFFSSPVYHLFMRYAWGHSIFQLRKCFLIKNDEAVKVLTDFSKMQILLDFTLFIQMRQKIKTLRKDLNKTIIDF